MAGIGQVSIAVQITLVEAVAILIDRIVSNLDFRRVDRLVVIVTVVEGPLFIRSALRGVRSG